MRARSLAERSAQTPSSKLRRASVMARRTSSSGVAASSVTSRLVGRVLDGEGLVALDPLSGDEGAPSLQGSPPQPRGSSKAAT